MNELYQKWLWTAGIQRDASETNLILFTIIQFYWAIKEQHLTNTFCSRFPSPKYTPNPTQIHTSLHNLTLINNINKTPAVFHYLSAGFLELIFLMCLIGNKVPLERGEDVWNISTLSVPSCGLPDTRSGWAPLCVSPKSSWSLSARVGR